MQIEDSERLRFTMMGDQDADLLYELDQDPEVMRHLTDGTPTPREDIFNKALPRMRSYSDPDTGWGVWKVLLKEQDDEFLGWVLIRPMYFSPTGEMTARWKSVGDSSNASGATATRPRPPGKLARPCSQRVTTPRSTRSRSRLTPGRSM